MDKQTKENLALLRKMYESKGRVEHFDKNIAPNIHNMGDLDRAIAKSFAPETQTQFDGTLQKNEFVDALFNIYTQLTLNTIKGEMPFINIWLKDAPFSGSQGYISQDLKVGQAFSQEFQTSDFNPEERPANLQVISTSLRRKFSDSLSMEVIGRAASKEGGLMKYMQDRIALLGEDYIQFIKDYILLIIDAIKGKEITINVPVELQGVLMLEQRARYILQHITEHLKYIGINSSAYTDTGFTSRTPKNELYALWNMSASSEMSVQALGMLRDSNAMNGIKVKRDVDIPMDIMEDFYVKFTTPKKIHYSKSLNVATTDNIGVNLKRVYAHHYFVELDLVDAEPALTVKVVDSTLSSSDVGFEEVTQTSNTAEVTKKRLKTAKVRREKLYKAMKKLTEKYDKDAKASITTAPAILIGNAKKDE